MQLPEKLEERILSFKTQIFKSDPTIVIHYFNEDSDWFFTEFNKTEGKIYGYRRFGKDPVREEGWEYTTFPELEESGAQLDEDWKEISFYETIAKFGLIYK